VNLLCHEPPQPERSRYSVGSDPISAGDLEMLDLRQPHQATLIQVVPERTVEPNGVADYARSLACTLRTHWGVNTAFVTGTPSPEASRIVDEWQTISVATRRSRCFVDTITSLQAASNASAVLIHLSGYGYQERGAPLWLLKGLRMWKSQEKRVPLITVFHELYAVGQVWQSSFWLSPLQKQIARGILTLSSKVITPTVLYRDQLKNWSRNHVEVTCMPVFSNVGEPADVPPPCARSATAVVFGREGVEDRLFGRYREAVERTAATLGIKQIVDVGPRARSVQPAVGGVPIASKGTLPQEVVSELLQRVRFGFVAYPVCAIAKSGVFAAYAAHGVIPVVFSDEREVSDGLEPGRHFLDGLRLEGVATAKALRSVQSELRSWYVPHCLRVQAESIQKYIMNIMGRST
jgi:hypothetical protein